MKTHIKWHTLLQLLDGNHLLSVESELEGVLGLFHLGKGSYGIELSVKVVLEIQ